nr:uncharacterized G-patch domain protein DDB_G0278987-like [Lytechinus pictus]
MSSCQDGCDLTPNQETVVDNESTCGQNDFHQLPSVTVRDARTLSISSATSKTSDCRNSSSESYSPFGSPESSPNSSLRSSSSSSSDMMELGRRGSNQSSPTNMGDKGRSEVHLELDALESGVSQMRDKFEDLSSNNNNLHFSSPTKDKLRYNRRSLVRSSSSACSSISENMEDACSSEESDADRNSSSSSSSSSPRNKPPLQRSNAIRGDDNIQPSPRSLSPISPVEELETYSGIKTVVRRPKKSQNGGSSSPSWRWSVMGVGTGDYDAVTKASYKGRHPPPVSTSTPTGSSNHGNGHASVLRRGSVGLSSTSTLVSPRSNKLSTEFRRLSLQMDMPWRGRYSII